MTFLASWRFKIIFFILLGVLGACGRTPEPPPQLPQLARPVLALTDAAKTPTGVLVPRAAFVERAGVPGVFVLHEGRARFRMVKAGRMQGANLEILSGLTGSETLVLGDLSAVRDGSPIKIVETAEHADERGSKATSEKPELIICVYLRSSAVPKSYGQEQT